MVVRIGLKSPQMEPYETVEEKHQFVVPMLYLKRKSRDLNLG